MAHISNLRTRSFSRFRKKRRFLRKLKTTLKCYFFLLPNSRSPVVEIEGEVLLVETLLAELEELDLAGEVLPDELLGRLGHGRLVDVPVDLRKDMHLI